MTATKHANANLQAGTGITFKRGCLTYEGTITSRSTIAGGTIVTYEVDVNAPGGGPICDHVGIHDGQIIRVYS